MTNRPSTLPRGLRVELTRHRVLPGQSAEVDEWMQMLNDRADECRATLDSERMAVEVIFRLRDKHGEWLYWFELAGEGGTGLSEERAIDRDHIEYAKQAKEPGQGVTAASVAERGRQRRQPSWSLATTRGCHAAQCGQATGVKARAGRNHRRVSGNSR